MSVDNLQEKIRKCKNPSVLEISFSLGDLPTDLLQGSTAAEAYGSYCARLLEGLKDVIPAVRFSFSTFALLGDGGLAVLARTMASARKLGYYVLLDAPEFWSPSFAQWVAESLLGENSDYPCDGLVIGAYGGSDLIKPFLPYCRKQNKDIFTVVRTGNKSASELQDLLAGSRTVHMAAADYVNRYSGDVLDRCGYSRVGIVAGASSGDSLRNLRTKYPRLFILVEGYDYPNANAKNCASAFDRLGHGAAVCAGSSVTCAWKQNAEAPDPMGDALAAAQRMKKNLTRYISVL